MKVSLICLWEFMFVEPRARSSINNACNILCSTSGDLQGWSEERCKYASAVSCRDFQCCYLLCYDFCVVTYIAKCYLPEFVAKASTCLIFFWNFEYVRCNFIMRDVNALTQENAVVTVKLWATKRFKRLLSSLVFSTRFQFSLFFSKRFPFLPIFPLRLLPSQDE